jgi:hypothetical protein
LQGVCQTVRRRGSGRPRVGRTIREGSTDSPPSSDRLEVRLGLSIFQGALVEVLLRFSDYPLEGRGPSAWTFAESLSPLLLVFLFRFEIVWGLFLGLVGLL